MCLLIAGSQFIIINNVTAKEKSYSRQIVNLMFTADLFKKAHKSVDNNYIKDIRVKLSKEGINSDKVSDTDLRLYIKTSTQLIPDEIVSLMRKTIIKLFDKLSQKDQKIFLNCLQKKSSCAPNKLSKKGQNFALNLKKEAKKSLLAVNLIVGISVRPKVIKKLKSMDENKFDNKAEVLKLFQ